MGVFKVFLILGLLTGVALWLFSGFFFPIPPLPQVKDNWWGKGARGEEKTEVRTFSVEFNEKDVADLISRLSGQRLKAPLEGVNFEYGFNTDFLGKIINYWRNDYNFKSREKYLNQYHHYLTNVDGIDVHYVHVKPRATAAAPRVLPLLLVHGWPGSFVEFYRMIPLLTQPRENQDFVFELIIPSIPGYGYSEEPHKPGCGSFEVAQMFLKLMKRLGHEKFYVQGGDWGALISGFMATIFPQNVQGLHLNMVTTDSNSATLKWILGALTCHHFVIPDEDYHKLYPMSEKLSFLMQESGYAHIQASKPDTVGAALSDSPVGLAAYILEKFITWTDKSGLQAPEGNLLEKYTLDELLDNVMVYWMTNSITSSMRFYAENMNKAQYQVALDLAKNPCHVPTGLAAFPNEIFNHPLNFMREKYTDIVDYADMERGGHFAAFEEPQLLADHIWKVFSQVEKRIGQNKSS